MFRFSFISDVVFFLVLPYTAFSKYYKQQKGFFVYS